MNIFIYLTEGKLEGLAYFFDYETNDWIKNFKFVRELGLSFIDISKQIIKKNLNGQKKIKNSF